MKNYKEHMPGEERSTQNSEQNYTYLLKNCTEREV